MLTSLPVLFSVIYKVMRMGYGATPLQLWDYCHGFFRNDANVIHVLSNSFIH
jgi:hypothetical protein